MGFLQVLIEVFSRVIAPYCRVVVDLPMALCKLAPEFTAIFDVTILITSDNNIIYFHVINFFHIVVG